MRSSSIVLLSGGLDSLASLHWALSESDVLYGLTFDYGQKAAKNEIEAAAKICRHYDMKHKVITLPWFSQMRRSALTNESIPLPQLEMGDLGDMALTQQSAQTVWIPNRNGVFLNIAAAFAEDMLVNWIVVGFNKEEAQTFPDNSLEFVESANRFFEFSTNKKVRVISPMSHKTKVEIVRWCLKEKVDFSYLWSCYQSGTKMCGHCESCMRLKRGLIESGEYDWVERLF